MITFEFCTSEVHEFNEDMQDILSSVSIGQYLDRPRGGHFYVFRQDGKVVGTATESQVRYGASLTKKWFTLDKDLFINAREYYRTHEKERNQSFLVLDEHDKAVGSIHWYVNRYTSAREPNGLRCADLWEYNFLGHDVNEYLLQRASCFIFTRLEEYTHAIAMYILKNHPEWEVCFFDRDAELNIWGEYADRITHLKDWRQLSSKKRCMLVTSETYNIDSVSSPELATLVYNSQSVMFSMIWGTHVTHPGNLHPYDKVLILDNDFTRGGLVDMIKITCSCAWQAEQQGYIPVADLSAPNCIQYWEEGLNVWEELFYPLNDLSLDEANKCQNVYRASLEERKWNVGTGAVSPYWREANMHTYCYANFYDERMEYFNRKTRLNEKTWDYVLNHAPDFLKARLEKEARLELEGIPGPIKPDRDDKRILGVSIRGTDYSPEANKLAGRRVANASMSAMVAYTRSLFATGEYSYIFLATEDQKCLDEFRKEFGNELIYLERIRVYHNYNKDGYQTTMNMFKEASDSPIDTARIYTTDLKCMAVCDDFISSMLSGSYYQVVRWSKGRFGLCHIVRDGDITPLSDRVVRVDIKNIGQNINKVHVMNLGKEDTLKVENPGWFNNNDGVGSVVSIVHDCCKEMKLHLKCYGNGALNLTCRAIDFYLHSIRRLKLWVKYTSIIINGKELLSEPVNVWHDKPFVYKIDVQDGDELDVEIHWQAYDYTSQEMSFLLQQML
ncbi:MAG: hypothetical protein J6N51_12600 [Selenomonas sp.]|nr:hypothetical protein [Selenomonas sp.]